MRNPAKPEKQSSAPRLPAEPVPPGSSESIPEYIADLCSGLIKLAEGAKLDTLAYLLGMARLEAEHAQGKRARRAAG